MTVTGAPRYAPEWLALREAADAAARAPELLAPLRDHLAAGRPGGGQPVLVVRDLGCGTGSMGRWLAPRLSGPQHWVLHDHDPGLLALAASRLPRTGSDGGRITVTTRQGDVGRLTGAELADTGLVTASALLDLLTREEVDRLAAACADAGCAVLLALSVAGRVELTPADPLDGALGGAFNDHQRRMEHGRRLLGPDAVAAAREVFTARGMTVRVRSSPWRLGPAQSALTAEWLRGWVGAAREQRPDLAPRATAYLRRRLEACEAGALSVVVHHADLLALPAAVRTGGGGA
ncbi:methyltransferase domain-containing protein [Streptomyces sp. NPDC015131]|uniref:methyltransferase domain-containing protein n=1 Tax=Streptomyces sp. NPDC015131 TaxID=3364941 RepID=UPI0037035FAC